MKIYTKTGDTGSTSLFGGQRIPKNSPRIIAIGAVDEYNASLGLAQSQLIFILHSHSLTLTTHPQPNHHDLQNTLTFLQNLAFDIGAALASPLPPQSKKTSHAPTLNNSLITQLENEIDRYTQPLPPLKQFILPGGSELAARLHQARTICRRAERAVARLTEQPNPSPADGLSLILLNRLSDLLFTLARYANHLENTPDIPWSPSIPSNH